MTRAARTALRAVGVAALLALVGCGSSPTGPTPDPTASTTSASQAPPSAPAASTPFPSTVGPAASAAVAADPALLDVLPRTTDRLARAYDAETTRRVAADPSLAEDAVGLAIALYTPTGGPSASGQDIAIASVVQLRDPAADDEWFRQWRDSYDAAACGQAGGVARHAEAEIGGRVVFIGSCAGGAFTHHTRLHDGALVVSVTSVGPGRPGETIMAGLSE